MSRADSRRRMKRQSPHFRTYSFVSDPAVMGKVEEMARNLDVLPDVLLLRLVKAGLRSDYGIEVEVWDDKLAERLRKFVTEMRGGTPTIMGTGEGSGVAFPRTGIDPELGPMV